MTDPNNISNELRELQNSLAGISREGEGFVIPKGYFDGFAEKMLARVRALEVSEELSALSPALAAVAKGNVYAVPMDYFDSIDPMLPNREDDTNLSPLLQGLKAKPSFRVPEGYFQDLAMGVNPATDADPYSSILESIPRVTPYTVPAGYFDLINPLAAVRPAGALISAEPIPEAKTGKVIRMGSFKWKQYAAAASVALLVSIATIFYFNRKAPGTADGIVASAAKEAPAKAIDDLFELDDAAVDYSLQSDTRVLAAMKASDAKEISNLVKNVPDKEIQAFLNETASAESDIDDDPLLN